MKVLILGTSHVGAFQAALPEIEARFPALNIALFGVPGKAYWQAQYRDGVFALSAADRGLSWIKERQVDLSGFDAILLTGLRFGFTYAARLITTHDIVEARQRRGYPLMSRAAMRALLAGLTQDRAARVAARFGTDARLTLMPAPAPLARSSQDGPAQEHALSLMEGLTHGAQMVAHYEQCLADAVQARGYRFAPQPETTLAAPFMTRDSYALQTQLDEKRPDNRHMNADYGFAAFSRYAEEILGLAPLEDRQTETIV